MTEKSVADELKDAVQGVLTEHADRMGGPQLVGDLLVLVECHMSDGDIVLRHFDSMIPSWRQMGMLRSAINTLVTEELLSALVQLGVIGGEGS